MPSAYCTVAETAERLGLSDRQIRTMCANGRLKGAYRHSGVWFIPEYARPEPKRKPGAKRRE